MTKPKPRDAAPSPPIALPAFEVPNGVTLVDRSGVSPTLTEAGCAVVEAMAAELYSQEEIASTLGLSVKSFRNLLGKATDDPMTPARAAWEAGTARNKSELLRLALYRARRGSGLVDTLFLLKAQHGLRDQGPAVNIDATGPRINFTLPGSMAKADWYKSLGITGPIDTRPEPERKLSPFEVLGLQPPAPQLASTTTESEPTGENHEESKA